MATSTVTSSISPDSPVGQFAASLTEIVDSTSYNEMWGVQLKGVEDVPTTIVLTKFLRANNGDLSAAKRQLISALEWRKRNQPLNLVNQAHSRAKFDKLGYITTHRREGKRDAVVSWNIYGAAKSQEQTFGDLDQ